MTGLAGFVGGAAAEGLPRIVGMLDPDARHEMEAVMWADKAVRMDRRRTMDLFGDIPLEGCIAGLVHAYDGRERINAAVSAERFGRWLAFDGEIHNAAEIRRELAGSGHPVASGTEADVFLAAYALWRNDCFVKMNGGWAFALYDPARNVVVCGRDHLGIKPLYWFGFPDGGMAFASTPEFLFTMMNKPRRLDPAQLGRYLITHKSDDRAITMFEGIRQLQAGHIGVLDLRNGSWNEWRYWSPPAADDLDLDETEALDRFQELFEDAVKIRLRGDVPVALTLSGGIDSTAIAIALSRAGASLPTFTSYFPEFPDIDESGRARQTVAGIGLENVAVKLDSGDCLGGEKAWIAAQGGPFASLSGCVHWLLLDEIRRRGGKAVLNGQGGDELFWGYESFISAYVFDASLPLSGIPYRWHQVSRRIRYPWVMVPLHYAARRLPGWTNRALALRLRGVFTDHILMRGREELVDEMGTGRVCRRFWLEREVPRCLLPSSLLRQDDRNARALGLVSRMPFLDHRLVEFSFRLPLRHSLRDGWTKYLVRRYIESHGFGDLAWRTHKLGFDAPQRQWQNALWWEHGKRLLTSPLAGKVLAKRMLTKAAANAAVPWDAYNILRLGELCGLDL